MKNVSTIEPFRSRPNGPPLDSYLVMIIIIIKIIEEEEHWIIREHLPSTSDRQRLHFLSMMAPLVHLFFFSDSTYSADAIAEVMVYNLLQKCLHLFRLTSFYNLLLGEGEHLLCIVKCFFPEQKKKTRSKRRNFFSPWNLLLQLRLDWSSVNLPSVYFFPNVVVKNEEVEGGGSVENKSIFFTIFRRLIIQNDWRSLLKGHSLKFSFPLFSRFSLSFDAKLVLFRGFFLSPWNASEGGSDVWGIFIGNLLKIKS